MQKDVVAVTVKGVLPTANGCAVFLGDETKTFAIYCPGLELDLHPARLDADVGLPVYQRFTGNQLAASVLFRVAISYAF